MSNKGNSKISDDDKTIIERFFFLKENQKFDEAIELLEPFIKKYPEEYKLFFLLGSTFYQINSYKKSIIFLKKAISLNPSHSLASLTLIHSLGQLNKWNTAINELRRFLIENKLNIDEHLLLLKDFKEGAYNFATSERVTIEKLFHSFFSAK